MKATLLGTGDSYGVPAPTCGCEYCISSDRRLRPSVLITNGEDTILLDAGPDVKEQLAKTATTDIDHIFITHHHFDHKSGLCELFHITLEDNYNNADAFDHPTHGKSFSVSVPGDTMDAIRREYRFLTDGFEWDVIRSEQQRTVGDLVITAFDVAHGRKQTFGYHVEDSDTGETLVYAPDMATFVSDAEYWREADVLVVEGAEVVGVEIHGLREDVLDAIEAADATETYLVNVSEHTAELHTEELISAGSPYSVVPDFTRLL